MRYSFKRFSTLVAFICFLGSSIHLQLPILRWPLRCRHFLSLYFFHSWQKSTKNLSSIFNPKAWLFCGFSNHRHRIIVRDPSILRFNGRDDETECSKQFFCSDSHQKKTLQPKIVLRLWLHQIFLLDLCEPYNLSNM